jgi:hypothetical protein
MFHASHFLAGFILAALGWLIARGVAGAWRFSPTTAVAVDVLPVLVFYFGLLAELARPISAGALTFCAFVGFAFADLMKRRILREPVVFTDISEVAELLRHPELYLPFVGTGRVIFGVALGAVVVAALVSVERTAFAWSPWLTLFALATSLGALPFIARALLQPAARRLRGLAPSGEPFQDARRLGPFAMLGAHGLIARAERPARRAAIIARGRSAALVRAPKPPLVLVQGESFFDARRLHPAIARDLLPAFDFCRERGPQWGRLAVPTWGALTPRTEFSILTGAPEEAIGLDRFNPYHAFARATLPSLASRLREQGYRTICVHPFDRRFYRRDLIIPRLGFDLFLGEESFPASARAHGYIGDRALADYCATLLRENRGQPVFIFAITIENHGPWSNAKRRGMTALAPGLAGLADYHALEDYLGKLKSADAMLQRLTEAMAEEPVPGALAYYGDHLPSLSSAYQKLGFEETSTDYVLWSPRPSGSTRVDLAAEGLGEALLTALYNASMESGSRVTGAPEADRTAAIGFINLDRKIV